MTTPANLVSSVTTGGAGVANVGAREDLEDMIYRVAPEETPFVSNIGRVNVSAVYHEWQTETLASASATNAQLEGDDYTLGSPNIPTRLGNTCQILAKAGGVSRTQEVINKAGRDSELARQKTLKGIEARRDLEMRAIGNYAAVAESGSTTRKFGGLMAFITSNDSRGATGSDGGFSASPGPAAFTPGTQRTFTEALVKAVMATAFGNGATGITQAYMSGTHKQQFAAFTGLADIRSEVKGKEKATITAGADVYVSDFGAITLVPHAYALTRDCVLVDPNMVAIGTLDGWKSKALASSGDNEKFLLTGEKTLVCKNEKAHAGVFDLT